MSKQALGILAGILLLVAAWAFGYKVLGNLADGRAASNSPVSIAPIEEGRDAPQVRRAVNAEGANRLEKTAMPLRYRSYEPDMSGETTRACLQFSEDLDPKRTDYMDYIDVEPGGKFTTQVRDNQLCLSGFDYDEQYEITLKQGLPAQEAEGLEADDSLTIIFGDKPSVVAFSGDGIILPRIGAQGLAIETVNVDILEVEVFRVSDRILARRSPSSGETTDEGRYSWEYDNAGTNVRELIWDGEVDVDGARNQSVTTVLPLTDLVGALKPGAYVVAARRKTDDSQSRPARSWRWIISTDLALTTYQGADGLGVTVRSIDSAHVVANTRVALIANNNDVLGEAVTDRNGHVNFPAALMEGTGPVSAQMLMAYGKAGDFAMLDLSRAPLDLSDRNIGGRKVYGEVDVYAYTDRGVYRPGENVHLTMMLRDSDGRAVDREATLSILKPNGMEAYSERVSGLMAGTLVHDYAVSRSAPRGIWQAVIDIDGIGVVGMADFSVEDFVPQKITVDLETSDEVLRLSSASTLTVRSDFLYGAPGKDLEAEADMRVRVDPRPFPAFKDYHFGMADESFQELDIELGKSMTDATGMAQFDMGLEEYDFDTRAPLRAEITAGVAEPGGRYIQNSTRVPLHAHDFYLAIKPSFDDDRAPRRANADFSVIAVDDTGKPVDMDGLDWELIEEEWDYHWYRQNGRWHYRRDVRDLPMAAGEFAVSSEKPATLTQRLDWGHYRLIVTAPDNQAKASYRFAVGWRGANTSDSPDKLSIAAPSAPTRIGQSVKLTLNAPYAGQGELVIASDKVHEIRNITIPKGGSELTIKASENWGAGAYAMLTLYTPRSASERPIPRRAVGIAYMPVNVDAKTIGVEIDAPKLTRPRQTQKITLKLTGATEGTNYVTLAAIDEGILLLTKYKSPSPEGFYFGKTALGVELRDDYARLLNPNMGAPTIARSGGDGLGGEGLTSVPVKIVSLFNGPVTVRGGKTTIEVE
ncbi:MAG: MG2 domain-containing protein, partial [Robiginitomaculum sp.]